MKIEVIARGVRTFLSSNAPALLTGVGVAGVITTAILAVKATPQAQNDIWDAESGGDKATPFQIVQLTWKHYLPAGLSAAAAISAIIAANTTHNRRNAALLGAYTLADRAFSEYREEMIAQHGENKDRKVRDKVAEKRLEEDPLTANTQVYIAGGESLCYDSITGRYFMSDIETIRKAQNDINASVINHMYVSQNDFYRAVGLPTTGVGEELGWTTDVMMDIQFSTIMTDEGKPALYLDYRISPIRNYYKMG